MGPLWISLPLLFLIVSEAFHPPSPPPQENPWVTSVSYEYDTGDRTANFTTVALSHDLIAPSQAPNLTIGCRKLGAAPEQPALYEAVIVWGAYVGETEETFNGTTRWDTDLVLQDIWVETTTNEATMNMQPDRFVGRALQHTRALPRLWDEDGRTGAALFNIHGLRQEMDQYPELCDRT